MTGWPVQAHDLLHSLQDGQSAAEHDRLVRAPMQALCDELGVVGGYGRAWISARTEDPVTWLRTGATVWVAQRVRITALFDLTGLHVEGGWTGKSGAQLWRYRGAVDADRSGRALAGLVATLAAAGYAVTDDGCATNLTRMPAGYGSDHPRAELLRRRSLMARLDLGTKASDDVVDRVRTRFEQVLPLATWFATHVVPGAR